MNLIKHMEAVFVATVVLTLSGSVLIDNLPEAQARSAAVAAHVPTVVVKAKRMTAAEKQQSLQAEREAAVSQL